MKLKVYKVILHTKGLEEGENMQQQDLWKKIFNLMDEEMVRVRDGESYRTIPRKI